MKQKTITKEELLVIHDKLADVLCYMKGVEATVKILPTGSKEGKQALLDMCNQVKILTNSKVTIREYL